MALWFALVAAGWVSSTIPLHALPVRTANAACERVKTHVSVVRHFPVSAVAFCDRIRAKDSPKGFYVLALHGHCREAICGSTNMGWFAIRKTTGRVFEWNVADWKLGPPVDGS